MKGKQRPIILASGSPRRKELLAGLGVQFDVRSSDVAEDVSDSYSPAEVVEILAERKAEAIAQQVTEGLVIGSDTIVVLNNEILGKPGSAEEAFSMLKKLQGTTHLVYSGLAIIDVENQIRKIGHQFTQVTMRAISDSEINQYIATNEPMDKAGAYAIQGLGAIFIEEIKGDFYSVVGMPLLLTTQYLKELGVDVLSR